MRRAGMASTTMSSPVPAQRPLSRSGSLGLLRLERNTGEPVRRGPVPPARRTGSSARSFSSAAVAIILLVQSLATAATATLTVGEAVAPSEGGSVSLPVLLTVPAGQRVAGIQFDVEFDPSALQVPATAGIVAGSAAKAAGKQVSCSVLAPGQIRVLVIGFNQETMSNGEVAAISFSMKQDHMHDREPVRLHNALLSDPAGIQVPVAGQDGGVNLANAAPSAAPPTRSTGHAIVVPALGIAAVLAAGAAGGMAWRRRVRQKSRAGAASKRQKVIT